MVTLQLAISIIHLLYVRELLTPPDRVVAQKIWAAPHGHRARPAGREAGRDRERADRPTQCQRWQSSDLRHPSVDMDACEPNWDSAVGSATGGSVSSGSVCSIRRDAAWHTWRAVDTLGYSITISLLPLHKHTVLPTSLLPTRCIRITHTWNSKPFPNHPSGRACLRRPWLLVHYQHCTPGSPKPRRRERTVAPLLGLLIVPLSLTSLCGCGTTEWCCTVRSEGHRIKQISSHNFFVIIFQRCKIPITFFIVRRNNLLFNFPPVT